VLWSSIGLNCLKVRHIYDRHKLEERYTNSPTIKESEDGGRTGHARMDIGQAKPQERCLLNSFISRSK